MQTATYIHPDREQEVKEYLPKEAVFYDLVNFFSIFSDITRLKMLSALSVTELCVTDLSLALSLNQTTVSHQLRILRDAGFVGFRREGKIIYYRVINKYVNDVMLTGVNYLGL